MAAIAWDRSATQSWRCPAGSKPTVCRCRDVTLAGHHSPSAGHGLALGRSLLVAQFVFLHLAGRTARQGGHELDPVRRLEVGEAPADVADQLALVGRRA